MLRTILVALCGFLLRTFFRRIEVVGQHHLPAEGAVLFALNHPSGLIDPLFVLCLSGRRVSFLAKEPLFRMPVIGFFVRAFESLPVYRSRDGGDPKQNRAMMTAAVELLARGNALALFPEGTSHSDPTLKRFRSGAARIALSARALTSGPVRIVPAALYYENKQTFRSRAVFRLGAAIDVPKVPLDETGESPREAGLLLTEEVRDAIEAIMPTAESAEALVLTESAERILSAAVRDTPEACEEAARLLLPPGSESSALSLAERMARRRHLLDKYRQLMDVVPDRIEALIRSIQVLSEDLSMAGVPIDALPYSKHSSGRKLQLQLLALMLTPAALVGLVVHAPAYHLIRMIAFRYSGDQLDVMATVKLLAGLLLFPLTWIATGLAVGESTAPVWGVLSGLMGPLFGYATVFTTEIWASLRRTWTTSSKGKKAGLDWPAIIERRARIAQEMARVVSLT